MGFPVDVIEPCGFLWDERRMRRAGMDYVVHAQVRRHVSWEVFHAVLRAQGQRLILLTTSGGEGLPGFAFRPDDVIMVGRESAGVPEAVAQAADVRLRIPMRPEVRSLNVALAATLAVGEALRQLQAYP